jgi:hypothetical protein
LYMHLSSLQYIPPTFPSHTPSFDKYSSTKNFF